MAQRNEKIICVKISQRILHHSKYTPTYDYFPYDRVYLAREKLAPAFRKTFRYYLSMALDKELLKALNALSVDTIRESTIERDDYRRQGSEGKPEDNFKTLIRNPKGWILIVPTHVKSKYKDKKKFKNPYASEVAYLMSRVIQRGHNDNVRMPQISFYTPDRVIPLLCAVCKNLPGFHTNECTPGRHTCKLNIESELPLDSEFYRNCQRSLEETGGEA